MMKTAPNLLSLVIVVVPFRGKIAGLVPFKVFSPKRSTVGAFEVRFRVSSLKKVSVSYCVVFELVPSLLGEKNVSSQAHKTVCTS